MNIPSHIPTAHPPCPFDKTEFRLTYIDLYREIPAVQNERDILLQTVIPVPSSIPLLADTYCVVILGTAAQESLIRARTGTVNSEISLQACAESYARKAGVIDWIPPKGLTALIVFRARVLARVMATTYRENLKTV